VAANDHDRCMKTGHTLQAKHEGDDVLEQEHVRVNRR
jgi:hypothetical protein